MSGDYETLEKNQPKITYFQKRSENNTEWLDELINQIEDMKNNISKSASVSYTHLTLPTTLLV